MLLIIFATLTTIQAASGEGRDVFTPPPMTTPPMPSPPSRWDTRDIKYYFRKKTQYCKCSEVFFCDPDRRINRDDSAKIVHILNTDEPEACVNSTSRGLSIGVAVINKISLISEKGLIDHMKPFNQLVRDEWGTLDSKCDAAILLFVSCADFSMYESLGLNTLSIVDTRCRNVFNLTEPIFFANDSDCFKDMIEPRMLIYQQILDGTHTCYTDRDDITVIMSWIFLGCILFVMCLIVCGCVVYIVSVRSRRRQDVVSNVERDDVARQTFL